MPPKVQLLSLSGMGWPYEKIVRPWFFRMDPEDAHEKVMGWLRLVHRYRFLQAIVRVGMRPVRQPVEVLGLRFPNRIGLAAGFDKNAEAWKAMAAIGFGHVEVGTVTWYPQPGNPKPRMFRYPQHQALVNRMGFNNQGAEAVAERLKRDGGDRPGGVVLGINLGKSKITPLEEAGEDYRKSFEVLYPHGDYFVVNVSSPNTPNLRDLQAATELESLLGGLASQREKMVEAGQEVKPLLLKIAPDLTPAQIEEIVDVVNASPFDGMIATNTTIQSREVLGEEVQGGMSGAPLHPRSVEVARRVRERLDPARRLIGAGGIGDEESDAAMRKAGADLLQVYSALVYRGPGVARDIAKTRA